MFGLFKRNKNKDKKWEDFDRYQEKLKGQKEEAIKRLDEINSVLLPWLREYKEGFDFLQSKEFEKYVDGMTRDKINHMLEEDMDKVVVDIGTFDRLCVNLSDREDIPRWIRDLSSERCWKEGELVNLEFLMRGGFRRAHYETSNIDDIFKVIVRVNKKDIISIFNKHYVKLGLEMVEGMGDSVVIFRG